MQQWEIQIIDDGQDDEPITPNYEDYQKMYPEGFNPFGDIEFHPIGGNT